MSELEEQIAEQIAGVETSLTSVDEVFGNLSTVDYDEVVKKMSSLDRAKYDLTNLYAINSLFWMYVRSFGEDPKNLSIKEELDRIKQQMMRVKQITEKVNMPRVNKEAAQRIIKHELWDPKKSNKNKQADQESEEDWNEELMETDSGKDKENRGKKRKYNENETHDDSPIPKSSSGSTISEDEEENENNGEDEEVQEDTESEDSEEEAE